MHRLRRMQQSVLLCISTILDSGNHYSKMMEMTDAFGSKIFETIQITLVCGLKCDQPPRPNSNPNPTLLLNRRLS